MNLLDSSAERTSRLATWCRTLVLLAAVMLFGLPSQGQTIWDFGSLSFSNSGGVGTDVISAQTSLTRGPTQPVFNSACEPGPIQSCSWNPCNTEWAYGVIANWNTLTYGNLYTVNGCSPPSMVGQSMVCHLIAENIYLQITWNSWGAGGSGGFSYTRTTGPSVACTGSNGGTISPGTVSSCAGNTVPMSSVGYDVGLGASYQWEVSSTSGSGFVPVTGGSGATTPSYTTAPLPVGTFYYRLRVTCTT
jgi:hypothetical protein